MSDDELWDKLVKTVKPIEGRPLTSKATPKTPKQLKPKELTKPAKIQSIIEPPVERRIDGHTRRKLGRGQINIESRIDLHGLGIHQAYDALTAFIYNAKGKNQRTVLVITGKGKENKGILRSNVPKWLKEPGFRDIVLDVVQAHIKHGGAGAWYVVLRKR
jgi:DNA-nicking Smr family endonuclease